MRLVIEHHGDVQLARTLVRIGEHAGDVRPAFRAIISDLEQIEDRQFGSEGGYGSGGWAPLAESTLRAKQAKGQPTRINVATGESKAALTGGGGGSIRVVTPSSMAFGANTPGAKFAQKGTARMPARPMLELPEQDRRDLPKRIQRFVVTGSV